MLSGGRNSNTYCMLFELYLCRYLCSLWEGLEGALMKPYHQLTREQRYQIAALRETGQNQNDLWIAYGKVIGVNWE